MKSDIASLIAHAIQALEMQETLPKHSVETIQIDKSKDNKHGDYASNIALILAKKARMNPRVLAENIIANIPDSVLIDKLDIAGPGFINFFLAKSVSWQLLKDIHAQGSAFGKINLGQQEKVIVEFVSANPTGPLHVGHGRNAAFGATIANLLAAIGYDVHREYYVNDAGRQMDILATSVWLRYLSICGETILFPSNGYRGDYIVEIAHALHAKYNDQFKVAGAKVMQDLPLDLQRDGSGDKEKHIDALIERAKSMLSSKDFHCIHQYALDTILSSIKEDLQDFRVTIDEWFSERKLVDDHAVKHAINQLQEADLLYQKEGATWFAATRFGDDKDRVVLRDNGQHTYFASDIAYHLNKFDRGYTRLIDVFGADHHGYIARMQAAIRAFGKSSDQFNVMLVQFAILYRGTTRIPMSSRQGTFVTLRALYEEIGTDAARFFYVMRKNEQHMDFDLELAKSQSNDNPVYYIQYAHARICSVLREANEKGLTFDSELGATNLSLLDNTHEQTLITRLSQYQDTLQVAAEKCEPHLLAHYLKDLSNDFHSYYNAHKFIIDDEKIRNARLYLITACRQIIVNGLELLDVSAPQEM